MSNFDLETRIKYPAEAARRSRSKFASLCLLCLQNVTSLRKVARPYEFLTCVLDYYYAMSLEMRVPALLMLPSVFGILGLLLQFCLFFIFFKSLVEVKGLYI
jgi:hypothetical protein